MKVNQAFFKGFIPWSEGEFCGSFISGRKFLPQTEKCAGGRMVVGRMSEVDGA